MQNLSSRPLSPDCDYGTVQQLPSAPDPPKPPDHHLRNTGLIVLATLIGVFILDGILWKILKWPTISQWFQRMGNNHKWFRWIVGGLLFMLGWHLIFSYPWEITKGEGL